MTALVVRPLTRADRPYVVSTWYQSAREAWSRWEQHSVDDFAGVTLAAFERGRSLVSRTAMNAILDRVTCLGAVVCIDDDPTTIVGWAAAQPGVVHWVHVRHTARRQGVGAQLMDAVQPGWRDRKHLRVTYLSHAWPAWRRRGAVWDPDAGRESRDGIALPG